MSIQRVAAILAVTVAFLAAESAQAQTFGPAGPCFVDGNPVNPYFYPPRTINRIIDVNCHPVRVSFMRQLPRYIPVPVPVPVFVPQVQPNVFAFNQQRPEQQVPQFNPMAPQQAARPTPAPAAPVVQSPAPVLPRQVNDTPAEPTVRMRYVELTVSGVQSTADADKLTAGLDKIKASRTVTVKRKAAGEATVKVWYSEREPLQADTVIQAVNQLGYKVSQDS